jgi:O-antigen/teichoic acid export membrane protein
MPEMPRDRTSGGAHPAWPVLEAAGAAVLSCVSAFVVARIVGPAELGIGAAAVAVHVLLWVAVNALFADPLTQSASTDPREISSAFWASTGFGMLAAGVQAGCGPVLAAMLDDARLVPMCLALALPLPLVGAAGAVQGLLTRARRYDVLAARAVLGQGLGTLLGIVLALRGAGGCALVAQQAATVAVGAMLLLARAGWRPVLAWKPAPVLAMLRQGLPITGAVLAQLGRYRLFVVLVGALLGPAALGHLHLAFRLVDTARELLATALWRLLLPGLSDWRDDLPGLATAMERALRLYAVALFPVCGLMLVGLAPLTAWLLGPDWADSGEAALPLVALMGWTILAFAANVAAITRGGARIAVTMHLGSLGLTLVLTLLLGPETPLAAAWIWVGAQAILLPWMAWRTAALLELPVGRLYRAGLPALAGTVGAVLAAFVVCPVLLEPATAPGVLFARLAGFGVAYLPLAVVLLRGLSWRGLWPARLADATR